MYKNNSMKEHSLLERISFLEQENDYLRKELTHYKQIIASKEEVKTQYNHKSDALEDIFQRNTEDLYCLKRSILNDSESENYATLRSELFMSEYAHEYSKKYGKLHLFPQIALHSVVSLTQKGEAYDKDDNSFFARKYLSKSIDFLICREERFTHSKIHTKNCFNDRHYIPLLAIEIDGCYHDTKAQTIRDNDKNAVLDAAGLRLIRYSLMDSKKDSIAQVVRKTLLDK